MYKCVYLHIICSIFIVFGFTQRAEAEVAYKQAVANANDCQYQVHISQVCILISSSLCIEFTIMYSCRNQFCVPSGG